MTQLLARPARSPDASVRRRHRRDAAGRSPRPRAWLPRPRAWLPRLRAHLRGSADAGMATAEYAIVTVAAVGFAGLLVLILRSDEVRQLLFGMVRGALSG